LGVACQAANTLLRLPCDFPGCPFQAIFVHSIVSSYLDEFRAAMPIRIPTPIATASAN